MNSLNLCNKTLFASALAWVICFSSQAEITEQSIDRFTVKHSFTSPKSVSTARHEFAHVGRWWTSEFTQSGNGRNMFFNGLGMYENMPNGEVVTHLTKVEKENNQSVWVGGLGNLGNENVDAKMKISIEDNHHGSKISMEYSVESDLLAQNKIWPTYIDTKLGDQMKSLKISLNNR
jgi:hypothetical protein